MSTLSELSLSSNGEQLVVRSRGSGADSNDDKDNSSDRDASTNGTGAGQVDGGSDGVLSLFSSSRSPPRRGGSAGSAAATSSSAVPLIPLRHIALLRRRTRHSGLSNGDCDSDNVHRDKVSLKTPLKPCFRR